MLTNEHLANLENLAKKTAPDTWDNFEMDRTLFCGGLGAYDNIAYMSAAHPAVILEMIEELRHAREMRDNLGRDKELKVMISQPMRGKSKEEILFVRDKAKRYIEGFCGHKVVDTYDDSFKDLKGKNTALLSLAKSLERMAECDAVYFCNGWRDARGCRVEFHAAKAYGLETWEEDLHQ